MTHSTSESSNNIRPSRSENVFLTALLMVVILSLGAYLRFVGQDWDQGHHLHPDERFLTDVGSNIAPVGSIREYFDTDASTLNPNNVAGGKFGFYVYGDFPLIFTRHIGELLGKWDYSSLHLVGRTISALLDLATIVLLFFIARRLFDWRIGLLTASLYAFAALPIQQSHFFTVDPYASFFVAAAFMFAVRLMDRHRWFDYVAFGLMLGLAMSSKVSTYPLAVILIGALAIRAYKQIAGDPSSEAVKKTIVLAVAGLIIAGLVTVIAFRVGQPYAFLPPGSSTPVDAGALGPLMTLISKIGNPVGLRPNPAWLDQMRAVRVQVSGGSDIPPNHQWGHRVPLLFPWMNMVRIGMGWPLGLVAWFGFGWAIWELARRHNRADRLILPLAWAGLVFIWQGTGWVTTMRYFLPIYGFLILLAAWALMTVWDRIQVLLASRGLGHWQPASIISLALMSAVVISTMIWGFAVSRIYTRPVTRVRASAWALEHIPSDVTLVFDTPEGIRYHQIGYPNEWPAGDALSNNPLQPDAQYTFLASGNPRTTAFEIPFSGTLTGIQINHVADPMGLGVEHLLSIRLYDGNDPDTPLIEHRISNTFIPEGNDPRGDSYTVSFGPIALSSGQVYSLSLMPDNTGPLVIAGASIATEGAWDDPLPFNTRPYSVNIWGAQYHPYELNMAWDDSPEKRELMQHILDHTDYITISSNRFYASLSRNPQRWPMTIDYYQALFSGELGFELVGDFASRPTFGPIEFFDDTAEEAWTVYDHPRVFIFRKTSAYNPDNTRAILGQANLNSVVKLIAKDAEGRPVEIPLPPARRYNAATVEGTDLVAGNPDWAQYFSTRTNFYSRAQPLTVLIWWLTLSIIGWLAWPILWAALPALADRAYPVARIFGLLLAAWMSWIAASLEIAPWSRGTGLIALGVIGITSAIILVRRWPEFQQWVTDQKRHLIIVEILTAILFIAFVLVRLGNPDLWHPVFGGEKPMDLAYLNAVLKTEAFPPYNPWFAGETINYYYFGFVLVGFPIKLLGIPTTLAYNLIVPTLFAMTGISAFSAAFNLVAPLANSPPAESSNLQRTPYRSSLRAALKQWPDISPGDLIDGLASGFSSITQSQRWPLYAAGFTALLLAVVLGNLDQVRTLLWGLAELGHGGPEWALSYIPNLRDLLLGIKIAMTDGQPLYTVATGEWYWNATRLIPVPINTNGIPLEQGPITEFPLFTFLYADLHAHMIAMPITLLAVVWSIAQIRGAQEKAGTRLSYLSLAVQIGLGALVIGALRPTNTWDWLTYLLLGGTTLVLGHTYRRGKTQTFTALLAAGLCGLAMGGGFYAFGLTGGGSTDVGIPLAIAGFVVGITLGYAGALTIFQMRGKENTQNNALQDWITLIVGGLQAAALVIGTSLLYRPYIANYELGYQSVLPWAGSRTPVWAYLDIVGLFLFIIITWLIVELWKPLKRTRRTTVQLAAILGLIATVTAVVGTLVTPVAFVVIPVVIAAIVLFSRPEQGPGKRLALVMLLGAMALSFVVEVVVLINDLSRMNTVFKFYNQIWLLLSIVGGASFGWLLPRLRKLSNTGRLIWAGGLTLLVFLATLYTMTAVRAKIADRWNLDAPHTLDGLASFMPHFTYYENGVQLDTSQDYDAIRWLQDNIEGTPVILEGLSAYEYLYGNRFSIYTGLPSVIGWNWHQRQQQPPLAPEVFTRHLEVAELYNTPGQREGLSLLDKYNVELVIVGVLERAYYDPVGLEKFERLAENGYLQVIYEREDTVIYRVINE
nr:glycosyltransferase family 39 protein [Anaerolineae bacterium]